MAGGLFDPSTIYNALQQSNLLPAWAKMGGASGEYNYETNRLKASPEFKGTVAHEMTHAAQQNLLFPALRNVYEKQKTEKLTNEEQRFLDAMSKIMLMGNYSAEDIKRTGKPNELYYTGKTTSEKADKKYNEYRTSRDERQAFGVGNMSVPGTSLDTGGQHYDPTMATEFSILMSLYNSLPDTVKKQAIETRKSSIEAARVQQPDPYGNLPFIDAGNIFADPFKPSIK